MAPEQWEGKSATPASDIWALALMIIELLKGRPPWGGENLLELARRVYRVQAEVPALLEGLPPAVARLIEQCLRSDPGARPSAGQVIEALETALGGPGDAPQRTRSGRRRAWPLVTAGVVVVLAALLAGYLAVRESSGPPRPRAVSPLLGAGPGAPRPIPVPPARDAGAHVASTKAATPPPAASPARAARERALRAPAPLPRRSIRLGPDRPASAAAEAGSGHPPAPSTRPHPARRRVGEGLLDL